MSPGDWVKWPDDGSSQHWCKGRLVEIGRRMSLVRPEGRHGHDEVVVTRLLRPWKSKNAMTQGARK